MIVAQDRVLVERLVKRGERWIRSEYRDLAGTLELESIGCALPMREIYAKIKSADGSGVEDRAGDPVQRRLSRCPCSTISICRRTALAVGRPPITPGRLSSRGNAMRSFYQRTTSQSRRSAGAGAGNRRDNSGADHTRSCVPGQWCWQGDRVAPAGEVRASSGFRPLDTCEVRIFQDLGGAELRAAIELVSPANKDREGIRRTFAAKCGGYLQHGINIVLIDVVTARSANLHRELADVLQMTGRPATWESATGSYAVAYRAVTLRKRPRVEIWPVGLGMGRDLPTCRSGWLRTCAWRWTWRPATTRRVAHRGSPTRFVTLANRPPK
jgi:hypothetical protein